MNIGFEQFESGKILPLIDEFYTLQGEGHYFGTAAYFIRIGGCDIGCRWCDTKYSWNPNIDKLIEIEQLLKNVQSADAQTIVVTGGEPTNYNLEPLCNLMTQNNIRLHIETSGAYKLTGQWDWICLSPKKNSPPAESILKLANELKVIIYEESDYQWAEKYSELVSEDCLLYLQPEWSRRNENTPKIVEYIKKNPKWRLSLQAHKYINIP